MSRVLLILGLRCYIPVGEVGNQLMSDERGPSPIRSYACSWTVAGLAASSHDTGRFFVTTYLFARSLDATSLV